MAPVRWTLKLSALALMLVCLMGFATGQCTIPISFHGGWYWFDIYGRDANIISVSQDKWGDLACISIKKHNNSLSDAEGVNATMLMKKIGGSTGAACYRCVDVLYRTKNVLQVRTSDCFTSMDAGIQTMCPGYDELPSVDEGNTYFRQSAIPIGFHGDWYWLDVHGTGNGTTTSVSQHTWGDLAFISIKKLNDSLSDVEGVNATMLMKEIGGSTGAACYRCVDVLYRTKNVLQVRTSGCFTRIDADIQRLCPGFAEPPYVEEVITYFRQSVRNVDCVTTFEGQYQFNYEVSWGAGGICDNPDSQIQACQDPFSPYKDNEVFLMTYARCPEVQTPYPRFIAAYQCMGSWFAMQGKAGYTFAAIADSQSGDLKHKFKCLMTREQRNTTRRWIMSRFSACSNLHSMYDGPVRLVLKPIPFQIEYGKQNTPPCKLPRNISGEWFTHGIQPKSKVIINDTHIKYLTPKNESEYDSETYLSCQRNLGTRYLMTKVTVGKCETDFVCYDILPIQDGIVRYRVGKPSRVTYRDMYYGPNIMRLNFEEACNSTSFGPDTSGKYQALIRRTTQTTTHQPTLQSR